ncbi:MAG: hypothetical protein WDM79_12490 [Terricaulis sp.]
MAVQPKIDAEAVLSQAKALSEALDLFDARLNALGPVPNPDHVADALAQPVRALAAAAKEET